MSPVAILDANVLYSASLHHLLIWLAVTEAFDAKWTEAIQDEWTRSLLRDRPDLDAQRIARTRQLMDAHIPDALVTGHEPMIAALALPDPDDRHVLAAAIQCGATFLVTKNLKDFPPAALMTHGIVAIHPDAFVLSLLETNPDAVIEGVRAHRGELVNPARSPTEYIAALDAEGMIATAAALRQIAHSL